VCGKTRFAGLANCIVGTSSSSPPAQPLTKPSNLNLEITPEQKQGYLDALAFPQIDARLLNIKKAHDRTCMWLLEQSEYQDWLDPDKIQKHHGFLWVKGKPGAGKSTMVKYALAHARKEMASSVIISFFFNARGEALEKSTVGMYRSLLFQLLTAIRGLQKVFIPLAFAKQKNNEVSEWSIEELKTILSSAIENLGQQHLACFIDALDECQEDQVRDMVGFLEHLGQLAVSSGIRLNIYLSSRHYPYISIEKGIELIIEGQQGHNEDIANYVNSKLKAGRSKKVDSVKAEILSRASGVFLWVVLVVQMLNKAYDHGQIYAIQKRLKEIPNELDDLFADILTRDGDNREELVLCLQWILYARRPLKRSELYFAMMSRIAPGELTEWDQDEITIQDMEKFILSCSKGLAEITKSKDQTVQFIHESVRDFLLQRNGLSKLQFGLGKNIAGLSHEQLKQCCQMYLAIDMSQHLPLDKPLPTAHSEEAKSLRILAYEKFPFLEYAVHNILYHANAAEGHGVSQKVYLEDFLEDPFLDGRSSFRSWILLDNLLERHEIRRHTSEVSLPYILAEKNLYSLIPYQLEKDPNINIRGERYGFPLYAALFSGADEAFRALLGAEMNACASGKEHRNSPFTTKISDHEEAIRILLQIRDDIKSFGNRGQSLLTHVDRGGYNVLVELVLDTGIADVDYRDVYKQTLLSKAAGRGHETVVKLLLDTGRVDVDSRDRDGVTPLSKATAGGHEAVVKLLLDTGKVDVNSRSNDTMTPLLKAIAGGHEAVVKLLLDTSQVDVDSRDRDGVTPLSWAAARGHETFVKLLLDTGKVDVNSRSNNTMTPLSKAAGGGHEAVVKLLLDTSQVDVDSRDRDGVTPLSWAAAGGHEAVVKLLLDTGKVDVDSRDKYSMTPLSKAASGGHEAVVKLLLDTGKVNVNFRGEDGWTPIKRAIMKEHVAIVKVLLATGQVDISTTDDDGYTLVGWAFKNGYKYIVRLLEEWE
jgi:ankyrin repeat protein